MKTYCIKCGVPITSGSRCEQHRFIARNKQTTTERGYNGRWKRFSERVRKLQRFCSDCGATSDLTVDHSREAWEAFNAGKPIPLSSVDVVCRSCNSKRGKQRPEKPA